MPYGDVSISRKIDRDADIFAQFAWCVVQPFGRLHNRDIFSWLTCDVVVYCLALPSHYMRSVSSMWRGSEMVPSAPLSGPLSWWHKWLTLGATSKDCGTRLSKASRRSVGKLGRRDGEQHCLDVVKAISSFIGQDNYKSHWLHWHSQQKRTSSIFNSVYKFFFSSPK